MWYVRLSRLDTNAILVPSGDQEGCGSWGWLERWSKPVPSGFTRSTVDVSWGYVNSVNAMRVPSGDHAGKKSNRLRCVTSTGVPPLWEVKNTLTPVPSHPLNASLIPSADQAGYASQSPFVTWRTFAPSLPMM